MAWISVHEQVIGGKLRELSKEIGCSQNEALGILIRFWLWGINNADKEGKIIGADKEDIEEVLAVGKSKDLSANEIIEAMITTGWLDVEEDRFFIHDWEEWQEQWYKFMDNKEKSAERQRRYRQNRKAKQAAEPPEETSKIPEESAEQPKKKESGYTTDFERFWQTYPRKVGKGEAYKKYRARLNDGYSPDQLQEAVTNYAAKVAREHTEEKYIKHAKTFLSDTLPFTDFIKKEQSQQESTPQYEEGGNPFSQYK